MANVPLPADLPTNWSADQIVAPSGAEVGLSEQHGYNYLMEQVNNAQLSVLDTYTKAESEQLVDGEVSTHNADSAAHPAIRAIVTAVTDVAAAAMPKAGGTFTGQVVAGGAQAAATAQVRNIILTDTDPGTGPTVLPEGTVVLVYE